MHLSSRAPAFLLLGLVVLAAALLIAGYGVAVGIGVMAGILLGLAAILAFLAMRPQVASNFTVLSQAPDRRQSGQEVVERHHRDWMRVAGVDASALRRLIAIGTRVEAGGVRAELVGVEIRDDGGIAAIVTHTHPPVGQTGHFVEVRVADDAGTEYASAGQASGGGNTGTNRYDIRFAPVPPADARVLTIRIDAFVTPFPGPLDRLEGPWEFRIPLD